MCLEQAGVLLEAESNVEVLHGGAARPLTKVIEARAHDARAVVVVGIHEDLQPESHRYAYACVKICSLSLTGM